VSPRSSAVTADPPATNPTKAPALQIIVAYGSSQQQQQRELVLGYENVRQLPELHIAARFGKRDCMTTTMTHTTMK